MYDLLEQPRTETGGDEYLLSHPDIRSYLVQNIWATLKVKRSGLCALFAWICCDRVMQVIVSGRYPVCYCPWKMGDLITVLGGVVILKALLWRCRDRLTSQRLSSSKQIE